MKKRFSLQLALAGIMAILVIPVVIHAAGYQKPWNCPTRVPMSFAGQYDADKDGTLSAAEEKSAQEAFMKLYDTDKDGALSREERQAARVDAHKAAFDRIDTNNDGVLSREEHDSAWQNRPRGFDGPGRAFMGRGQRPCR